MELSRRELMQAVTLALGAPFFVPATIHSNTPDIQGKGIPKTPEERQKCIDEIVAEMPSGFSGNTVYDPDYRISKSQLTEEQAAMIGNDPAITLFDKRTLGTGQKSDTYFSDSAFTDLDVSLIVKDSALVPQSRMDIKIQWSRDLFASYWFHEKRHIEDVAKGIDLGNNHIGSLNVHLVHPLVFNYIAQMRAYSAQLEMASRFRKGHSSLFGGPYVNAAFTYIQEHQRLSAGLPKNLDEFNKKLVKAQNKLNEKSIGNARMLFELVYRSGNTFFY